MDKDSMVITELGEAHESTMDSVLRAILGQLFKNDNATAYLEVTLQSHDPKKKDPVIDLKIQLMAIDGVKTNVGED